MTPPDAVPGFDTGDTPFSATVDARVITHWVYRSRSGTRPLVVLHELPGLTPACVALCERLVAADFRVHVPLLFGAPNTAAMARNFVRVCVRREISLFARHASSPLLGWLRALVEDVAREANANAVGVIGMCLTGNFALTLVAEPQIGAAVSCQPSLPVFGERALAMSSTELEASCSRARTWGRDSVLALRYAGDKLCPAARFARLRDEFGDSLQAVELPGAAHSTLTDDLHPDAMHATIDYLERRLGSNAE